MCTCYLVRCIAKTMVLVMWYVDIMQTYSTFHVFATPLLSTAFWIFYGSRFLLAENAGVTGETTDLKPIRYWVECTRTSGAPYQNFRVDWLVIPVVNTKTTRAPKPLTCFDMLFFFLNAIMFMNHGNGSFQTSFIVELVLCALRFSSNTVLFMKWSCINTFF